MNSKSGSIARLMLGASVAAIVTGFGVGSAFAADDQPGGVETVVVTGFRGSLEKALDAKRASSISSDSIYAEDIAKFPDLNLSESIQRLPGVAITRDAGEGRQIAVRGLGGAFTRVLINGMEALATTGGTDAQGGTNRTGAFDFNVFAADLFDAITVEKTSEAATEEGSLGATVDLHTSHPFDHDGFKFAASAKADYNDLAGTTSPRLAALVSDTFDNGHFGALLSIAYTNRHLLDEGASNVRWTGGSSPVANGFRSISPGISSAGYTLADFNTATAANNAIFHPRIPRFDKYIDQQHRLGATGSLQWQPAEGTLVTFDALYSDFGGTRDEEFLESFTFQSAGACNAPVAGPLGNGFGTAAAAQQCGINQVDILTANIVSPRPGVRQMIAGSFNGVDLRGEHRHDKLNTEFKQFTLSADHTFNDKLKAHAEAGYGYSAFANPIQTDVFLQQDNVQGYAYDYTGGNIPLITYGNAQLTNPAFWYTPEIREAPNWVNNKYLHAHGEAEYQMNKSLKFTAGVNWVEYANHAITYNRSNGTTANINATVASQPPASIMNDVSTYSMLETFNLPGMPAGNATQWLIPDLDKAATALHLYDPTFQSTVTVPTGGGTPASNAVWVNPFAQSASCFTTGCGIFHLGPEPVLGSNYNVQEDNLGGFLQGDFDTSFYNLPIHGNFGVRYVQTRTTATGYGLVTTLLPNTPIAGQTRAVMTITPTTASHEYSDVLPSVNLVMQPSDDFIVRLSAAKTMSRPNLGSLNPGVTINTAGNHTASAGNINLAPFRAKTLDLDFEYYFTKGSLISVAFFYKDINTFVQSSTSAQGVFSTNPFGLPDSAAVAACGGQVGCAPNLSIWTFTTQVNTPGGPLDGLELTYQQPFEFLPHPFDNFGFTGNFTYVDSKISYLNTAGVVAAVNQLTNLSHVGYNATLYYEDSKLSARISAAYRGAYLTSVPGTNGADVLGTESALNIDASATYNYTDNIAITLEGLNLTNQYQNQYFDSSNMPAFNHTTGREFLLGVRYTN